MQHLVQRFWSPLPHRPVILLVSLVNLCPRERQSRRLIKVIASKNLRFRSAADELLMRFDPDAESSRPNDDATQTAEDALPQIDRLVMGN